MKKRKRTAYGFQQGTGSSYKRTLKGKRVFLLGQQVHVCDGRKGIIIDSEERTGCRYYRVYWDVELPLTFSFSGLKSSSRFGWHDSMTIQAR